MFEISSWKKTFYVRGENELIISLPRLKNLIKERLKQSPGTRLSDIRELDKNEFSVEFTFNDGEEMADDTCILFLGRVVEILSKN